MHMYMIVEITQIKDYFPYAVYITIQAWVDVTKEDKEGHCIA